MKYTAPAKESGPAKRSWVLILAGVVLFVFIGCIVSWLVFNPEPAPVQQAAPIKQTQSMSSRIMFVGDVNWARFTQRRAEASKLGYDYITSGLEPNDRAEYNSWIGNFECPVTTRDIPYAQQVSNLQFNCRPEYLPTLAKYFTAATLANNHMDNNGGQWGLDQTRQNLEQNGIQYFGTYAMSSTDNLCEVVTLPAISSNGQTVGMPVALCGYMYVVDATPTDEQLAVMQEYAKVMPVIAMPHMGVEYRAAAESEKISAYRRMIDNGADMVIGAHPHVIQNSESYRGHLIAYSVGNFLFDQQSVSAATNLGLSVDVKLTVPAGKAETAYQKVAASCKAFKDDCLSKLQTAGVVRPQIGVSYGFGCFSITSNVPVRGTDAECAKAKQAATTEELHNLSGHW